MVCENSLVRFFLELLKIFINGKWLLTIKINNKIMKKLYEICSNDTTFFIVCCSIGYVIGKVVEWLILK